MNHRTTAEQRTTRRILVIAAASVLSIAGTGARLHAAHDNGVTVPPVPTDIEVLAPNEAFLVVTRPARRITYVSLQVPAWPGHCSPRKPRCSANEGGNSRLISSARTLLRPAAQYAPRGRTPRTRAPSGSGDGYLLGPQLRGRRRNSLAPAAGETGWSRRGATARREPDRHDVHPTGEYRWRHGALDRVRCAGGHWQQGLCAFHGRLLLL
jgi:hypothetical protein